MAGGEIEGKVRRYLTNRFWVIAFRREQVSPGSGGGCYPLDRDIRLRPRQAATLWVKKRACELDSQCTYREAAALFSGEIGNEASHGAVYNLVWRSGRALR